MFSLQTTHIVGVETGSGERPRYACLWVGCKVYGKVSSSLKWLESHVPRHGGKFAYPCIVEGCKMRFSSQVSISLKLVKNTKYFVSDNSHY